MGRMLWAAGPDSPALLRENIYQRAKVEFPEAVLFKPAEPQSNHLAFALAPWILQEAADLEMKGSSGDVFGELNNSNGVLSVDIARPTVYTWTDSLTVNGKALARVAYIWLYPSKARHPEMQGVRLTLDSAGQPAVVEVLAEHTGAQLIFISRRLETAAREEFGKPLSGRRFSVERSEAEAPRVVVARVFEDGPTTMGPMVYLNRGSRSVSTAICRCMPAQAKRLQRTVTYELVEVKTRAEDGLANVRAQLGDRIAFWPGEKGSDARLTECLRLPRKFDQSERGQH